MILDTKLKLKEHVKSRLKLSKQTTGALKTLCNSQGGVPAWSMKPLYANLIRPIFTYGSELWFQPGVPNSALASYERLEYQMLQKITGLPREQRQEPVYDRGCRTDADPPGNPPPAVDITTGQGSRSPNPKADHGGQHRSHHRQGGQDGHSPAQEALLRHQTPIQANGRPVTGSADPRKREGRGQGHLDEENQRNQPNVNARVHRRLWQRLGA